MDNQTIISIVAIVVSGAVGITGILLSLRKLWESDSIGRASRRTIALQMLSDEELALQKVKAECLSLEILIHANQQQLDATFDHLETESKRIVRESKELLRNVRKKRKEVVGRILDMKSSDIEAVIADAYNGRMLAEAQLYTTIRSREDTIRVYMNQ